MVHNDKCITGYNKHLYKFIKESIKRAKKVDIIVAFLMESGVRLLEDDLKEMVSRNIPVRILTGNYLNITQPSALYLIRTIMGNKVDLRFYNDKSRSFHAKAYMFEYEDGADIFIGSSNISKSALTDGIEWNYRLTRDTQEEDFNYYKKTFEDLFYNKSIIVDEMELEKYAKTWKKPKVNDYIPNEKNEVIELFKPRGAQIEALYNLNKTRLDGMDKGLVLAATGVGKTYLAAFDSQKFNRILFVAHREEILKQAYDTFKSIRRDSKLGFFMNKFRDKDCDILFATVQTLGKDTYLNEKYFKKNYFDYIVIDEFHHAVSSNYKNIINYFEPKFMLGLTATPDRLDNKDVFALCDYNVVYEVSLKDSINRGYLVPFRYYGIYDDSVDYEKIEFKNGKYNEKELEKALSINKRADIILKNYTKFKTMKALGFCKSKHHAEYMAKFFCDNGVKACAVYSNSNGEYSKDRSEAIEDLEKGNLDVIFSVDMFNEGVDIKSIDMVMLLRPTESPTIFLQQLGRGLRKNKNKKYLNVLDFIGNYKRANLVPLFLTGDNIINNSYDKNHVPTEEEYPEDCFVNFDFRLIDIFKDMEKSNKNIKNMIKDEYYRIKRYLNEVPSRTEMLTYIENDIYVKMRKKSKLNIFKNYLKFLDELNELDENEKMILNTKGSMFINMIEKTSMSKTYKMPLISSFYNNGPKLKINEDDIYDSFKNFYSNGSNKIDLKKDKSTSNYKKWEKKDYIKLAKRMPMKYLLKTEKDFFYMDGECFCLNKELGDYIDNDCFIKHFKDAVEFRTKEYYKNRLEDKMKY
ncbi:DEAD/DEAH box helicase family protein [Tepidibacter hydrothermalis]|uniref:DEAD/DEAH box helicase family protein n=1 Tax=Tepidibacter hydrothermalis TaxID=3036126 RepID=A0ABY8EJY1_9FIRM|nr:DEAD/DEAH box helicase family protein [Tepidibacter hydrothermalis]WFD12184.1 DEAD/DEAH box helicase family protein [Tepidibacter hydrothermalis]